MKKSKIEASFRKRWKGSNCFYMVCEEQKKRHGNANGSAGRGNKFWNVCLKIICGWMWLGTAFLGFFNVEYICANVVKIFIYL